MSIKASEISDLIKARIEKFQSASEARNVGTVVTVTDGICRIHGLADVRYGEMIEFPGNTFGLALNLEQDSVGSVVLGEVDGSETVAVGVLGLLQHRRVVRLHRRVRERRPEQVVCELERDQRAGYAARTRPGLIGTSQGVRNSGLPPCQSSS